MNNNRILKSVTVSAATALLLAACGGGGSSGGATDTRVVSGRITGFGSVVVNGVHYDVSGAAVTADGRTVSEDDLRVGMLVRLRGSSAGDGTGTAVELEFDDDLQGPVESVDLAAGNFVVLGQTVRVDAQTMFENGSLATLTAGNTVEVSGYLDGNGNVLASYVEVKAAGAGDTEVEVKGSISGLNTADTTFMLGTLTVDYSSAAQMPAVDLADGLFVEVKSDRPPVNGVLTAVEIELEDRSAGGEDGDEAEVRGVVTAYASETEFEVNGQPVRTTPSTVYEDGASPASVVLGATVEVEGRIDSSGVLIAEAIEAEEEGSLELAAVVDAVDTSAGTATIVGITISVDADTTFKDDSSLQVRYFDLTHIQPGDWLEVHAYEDADGALVATVVERGEAEDAFTLQGPLADLTASSFSLFGVSVSTGAATEFERNETLIPSADFFAQASAGATVEVSGSLIGSNQLLADKVELKD